MIPKRVASPCRCGWCSAHSRGPFPRAFGGGIKMRHGRTTVFFYRRNPLEKAALSIWRPRYSPGFAFQGDARGSIQATRSKRALPGGACVVAVLTVGRATEFFKDAKAPVFRFFVPF